MLKENLKWDMQEVIPGESLYGHQYAGWSALCAALLNV